MPATGSAPFGTHGFAAKVQGKRRGADAPLGGATAFLRQHLGVGPQPTQWLIKAACGRMPALQYTLNEEHPDAQ